MITIILSIISSLLTAAGKIFDYLYSKQMIDAGKTQQQIADLKKQVEDAHRALQARIDIERSISDKPDRLRDTDEFRRPD